jgi:hypothetical protein
VVPGAVVRALAALLLGVVGCSGAPVPPDVLYGQTDPSSEANETPTPDVDAGWCRAPGQAAPIGCGTLDGIDYCATCAEGSCVAQAAHDGLPVDGGQVFFHGSCP